MQRMGMVIGIKPEKIAEYKELHANCWPEILKGIEESNIRNYSIWLHEGEQRLFVIGSITEMTLQLTCRRWPMIQSPRSGGPSVSPVKTLWRPVRKENIGP